MEHVAVAINPRQDLIAGARLYDALAEAPGQEHVLQLLEDRLDQARWAVYRVRRAILPSARDPAKTGTSARQVRAVATGTRAAMRHALAAIADGHSGAVDMSDSRHPRVWLQRRHEYLPAAEECYAIAPHVVGDKERAGFEAAWKTATTTPAGPTIQLSIGSGLQARLDQLCQITGLTPHDAVTEALERWITTTLTDPAVLTSALDRLDREQQTLHARRDTLQTIAGTRDPG